MIARNFHTDGIDLLHPVIDMAGEKSGIIGSEFPLLNALIALISVPFGYEHWYGRLINLIVTSLGSFAFFKLIKAIFTERIAFFSTLILLTSIWFTFGRKIMPDTFSISLLLIGFWFGFRYLRGDSRPIALICSFTVFTALGLLCKIPALALMGAIIAVPLIGHISRPRMMGIFLATAVSVGIAFIWYFYWVPHLVDTYRFQLFFPKGFSEGLAEIRPLIPELFERFYFSALKSYTAFAIFLVGIFLLLKRSHRSVVVALTTITLLFLAFIVKTGSVFPLHNYYVIPFVPVMALGAGYFLARLRSAWSTGLMVLIAIESIANQQHDFFIKPEREYKLSLETISRESLPPDELVVINGGQSPTDMYFANRKGWSITVEQSLDQTYTDSLAKLGAQYLIFDLHYSEQIPDLDVIYEGEDYRIYRLRE
jgi:hypothetical protein